MRDETTDLEECEPGGRLPDLGGMASSIAPDGQRYSRYIVYADESGDHGMGRIDPAYPVFVLALCVFRKQHYNRHVAPAVGAFKFRHFGHDAVVLHEHEIRKESAPFRFRDRQQKQEFLDGLTGIISSSRFALISCVVDKRLLAVESGPPNHPYHVALAACLETLHAWLHERNQAALSTHLVVECRGAREDAALMAEFRSVCGGANVLGKPLPFELVFAHKRTNCAGLQFADLAARPVGLAALRPGQRNRAYEVLRSKFFTGGPAITRGLLRPYMQMPRR